MDNLNKTQGRVFKLEARMLAVMQGRMEMQGELHTHGDVNQDAKKLTEKLERYRQARTRKLNSKPESPLEDSDVDRGSSTPVEQPVEQQVPANEGGTLVEKLERYQVARALKLKEEQAHLEENGDAHRVAKIHKEQQPDNEATTLLEKLERYREARARKLEEKQGHPNRSKDAYREAGAL